MAFGKFFAELVAEGVIFRWIMRLWDTLKSGMIHPVVQEWAKDHLKPKGLDDESVFAFVLAEADMNDKNNVNKKPLLVRALNQLEIADKVAKTSYVKNFRLIIAMDAIGRGTVKVEKKDNNGNVIEVKNIPDPNYIRPGITILETMAEECSTEAEAIQFIIATGAMQDAPFGTIDEFKNWIKKTAWPWISSQWQTFRSGVVSTCQAGEQHYQKLEARMDAFDKQPLWQKIIDPRNWFAQF